MREVAKLALIDCNQVVIPIALFKLVTNYPTNTFIREILSRRTT
ncbi:hypothetical protein VDIAB_30110 [Vibrio diabolicus]|nr:hypothetical protein VDIAB_30110 [Vibrio diabolicus]